MSRLESVPNPIELLPKTAEYLLKIQHNILENRTHALPVCTNMVEFLNQKLDMDNIVCGSHEINKYPVTGLCAI